MIASRVPLVLSYLCLHSDGLTATHLHTKFILAGKYWQQLKLLDKRKVATNKEMFDCCIQHLSKAVRTDRCSI